MNDLVAALPLLLVGVMQWLMPSLVPPTLPFGVRIPRDRADAPVIAEQRRRYRILITGTTVVAVVVAILVGHVLAPPVGLGIEIIGGLLVYLRARARIRETKAGERWFEGRRQVTVADTSLRTEPEPFPWLWSLPAVLLTVATIVAGAIAYPDMPHRLAVHFGASGHADRYATRSFGTAFGPLLVQVASTAVLIGIAAVCLRVRAQLDAEDPESGTRHRRFVTTVARVILVLAACTSVTFLFNALTVWNVIHVPSPARVALNVVPVGIAVVATLFVAIRIGQSGSRLHLAGATAGGRTVNRDDDDLYRLGRFYYNPEDPAVFVPKRFGIGWALNLARPVTWLLIAFLIAVIVVPLVTGMTH